MQQTNVTEGQQMHLLVE